MKIFINVIIGIFILAVIAPLFIPATTTILRRNHHVVFLNNARQIALAAEAYESDLKTSGKSINRYKIADLTAGKYIDSQMIDNIERSPGTYVVYFPLPENFEEPAVRYFGPEGVSEIQLNNEANFYDWESWSNISHRKTEQGAAANP